MQSEEESFVSLSQVMYISRRRGWIVALAFLFALMVAAGVLTFVPGRYDATATASMDPGNINPVTETAAQSPRWGSSRGT